MERRNHAVGQRFRRFTVLVGAIDDLVIYVRKIADILHIVAHPPRGALHDVKHDVDAGVADVAEVINRYATDIEAQLVGLQRAKRFLLTGQAVGNTDLHGATGA